MAKLVDTLLDKGVEVSVRDANGSSWLGHVISWTPIVLMIAFLVFFMRQMQGGGEPELTRVECGIYHKTQIHRILAESGEGLSASEIASRLPQAIDDGAFLGIGKNSNCLSGAKQALRRKVTCS